MKKLILEESPTDVVFINQISDDSIIGVLGSFGKYYIARSPSGFFGTMPFSLYQDAPWYKKTLKEYVEEAVGTDFYVFKSEQELFNWLKQD